MKVIQVKYIIYIFSTKTARLFFENNNSDTVEWGDFGQFSNSASCISLLLLGMPLVLPEKLESQFLLEKALKC